jgi:hypothetical protein
MGTSNFHNVNSGRIYSIELEEEFEYDDLVYNLIESFESLEDKGIYKNFGNEYSDPTELRSYSSNVLGQIGKSKTFGDTNVEVLIFPLIRSGYYSGVNLDWYYQINIEGTSYTEEIPEKEHLIDDLRHYSGWNDGMSKIQSNNVLKWIETTKEELVNIVEKIYTENSEPLEVLCRFSNGETIYKKVEN